jgi:hypothetical protein
MLDLRKANRWKLPEVSYTNWNKNEKAKHCFRQWFSFKRYWSGWLWCFTVRGHEVQLDFRVCPWADMAFPNATEQDRQAVEDALKQIGPTDKAKEVKES